MTAFAGPHPGLPGRPAVVQANAQNVVGDMRPVVTGQEAAAETGDRRDECTGYVAKIDVEIFELGGPVSADDALDAGSDRPSDARGSAARRSRPRASA